MNRDRKGLWTTIGVIVLIVIVGFAMYKYAQKENVEVYESVNATSTEEVNTTTTATSSDAVSGAPSSAGTGTTLTYTKAVALYANKRVQFDDNCRAIPTSISLKNNVSVMFDNRSSKTRTISVDGTRYTLKGYGWTVIKLSHATIPYTVKVECGGSVGNGKIILE